MPMKMRLSARLGGALLLGGVLLMAYPTTFTAGEAAPLARWSFEKETQGWVAAHDCRVEARGGVLAIDAVGKEPYVHGPRIDCSGPALLRMRVRSRGEGQGRLYWTVLLPSLAPSRWGEDAVVYFDLVHDGEWHDYTLPIDVDGRIAQLRFDPCHRPGLTEVQWIELVAPPAESAILPAPDPGMPQRLSIAGGGLKVDLDTAAHRFTILDTRTGRRWVSTPEPGARLLNARRAGRSGMELLLAARATGLRLTATLSIPEEGALAFELHAADPDARFGQLAYPPRLEADLEQGALLFCNRSCGQLIGQRDFADYPVKSLFCYGNLGLDMPWLGVTDLARGDGAMLLLETPTDVVVDLKLDAEGRWWPQARWMMAMERWAYPRRASYRFTASGGYVALAKTYRRYAEQTGPWSTLEQKAKTRPHVARLKGAPSIWGITWGEGHPSPIRLGAEARAHGMARGILNGNGKWPGADMVRLHEMGFLTGEYDNYDDIRDGPPGITTDSVEKVGLRVRDGKPAKGWVTLEGVQYYRRASSQAPAAARRIVPPILKEYPFTARFLDVSSTVDLVEDYHPERRTDRRGDMGHRLELYRYMTELGLVVGGEHGKAWNAHVLDYAEGTASGPFWWEMPAGHLVVPKSRADIKENYLRYGMDPGKHIPLWELVFHDCLVTTWYWGDSSGYYEGIAPELGDRKDLCNLLYGTVPLFWVNHLGYGWNRHRARLLEAYRHTCKWHEVVGFSELLSHEFLSKDRLVQRTRFAGGAEAVVNFSDEPCPYRDGEHEVILAPRGFLARAPGFRQTRTVEDGRVVTRITAPEFISVQSAKRVREGWADVSGTLAVYRIEPGLWGCLVESAEECAIDLVRVMGDRVAAGSRVTPVGQGGLRGPVLDGAVVDGVVRLPGGPGLRVYALEAPARTP